MHQPVVAAQYVIKKKHQGEDWMLEDIDHVTIATRNKWTRNPDKAVKFKTRKEARELIEEFDLHDTFVGIH